MASDRVLFERTGLRAHGAGGVVTLRGDAARLEAIAEAHAAIDSPHVPAARPTEDGLVLEAPGAAATLAEVVAHLAPAKIEYAASIAFNEFLLDATEAGHRAGYALGGLAWSSVLCGRGGELWLLGFGFDDAARPSPTEPGACVAPELALGLAPSERSDVFVLHAMLRSLLPFTELPASYAAALTDAGRAQPLHHALVALTSRALAPDPALRPATVAELRALYRDVRPLAADMPEPDEAALAAVVGRAVAELAGGGRLVVDGRARTLHLDGAAVDLSRRGLLWRLTSRLLAAHADAPGAPVSPDAMIEAGWPDEQILPDAAKTRLYTAIRSLRKMGLEPHLWSRDGGYLLDPALRVERSRS